jgi:hypothetical protein
VTTFPRRRRRICRSAALCLVWLATLAPAAGVRAANEEELLEIIRGLEQRVEQLEIRNQDEAAQVPDPVAQEAEPQRYESSGSWADRVRLSGSANTGWYGGQENAPIGEGLGDDAFLIWDTRLFVEAELGRDVRVGEMDVVRDIGFLAEWNLMRLGVLENEIGELYADFQGLGGQEWANVQVGRFQIPVGESYLRFSQGAKDNPFITNTVGGPWFWDEGIRGYGRAGNFGWVTSMSDGETDFNFDPNPGKQFTLKLFSDPTPWLHLSVSGLRSGSMGSSDDRASGALWLGETWARPIGAGTTVPNYVDGVAIGDGPNKLKNSWLGGGDVILHFEDIARIWLGGGWYGIDSTGASLYDRDLFYWVAEVVLEGAVAAPALRPFYLGMRADGLGTYDENRGYLLDSRENAFLGWNSNRLQAYSVVLGWRMTDGVTLRAEYSFRDIGLVQGVDAEVRDAAEDQDLYGIEIGVDF